MRVLHDSRRSMSEKSFIDTFGIPFSGTGVYCFAYVTALVVPMGRDVTAANVWRKRPEDQYDVFIYESTFEDTVLGALWNAPVRRYVQGVQRGTGYGDGQFAYDRQQIAFLPMGSCDYRILAEAPSWLINTSRWEMFAKKVVSFFNARQGRLP